MRTASGLLLTGIAVAGFVGLATARAEAPVTIEKSLLGVRILQTYHDVLAKWGQPTLVLRGGEKFLTTSVTDPSGADLGGVQGVTYEGGGGAGPGGGGPGSGGPMMGGKMGGGGGGPLAGAPLPPGALGGGPGSGGPGGGGMGGGMGGGSSDADTSFGASGAYAWIYFNAKRHIYTFFAFNLEGRVLFIMERGADGGMPTQRGLHLGSTVQSLYDIYGWPDTIQEKEPGFILDYGSTYHAKFAVIKNHVVGIGVVLEESQRLPFFAEGGSGGGPGGGGGGMKPGGAGGGKMPRMGGASM